MCQNTEIFHESRAFERTFTREEWHDFCEKNRIQEQFVESEGFLWNAHDCCVNPHRKKSTSKQSHLEEWVIKTASFKGGWYYGISWEYENGGGGMGCWIDDKYRRGTEDEAIQAGAEHLLRLKGRETFTEKAKKELRELTRKEPVQLSLF